MSSIDSEIAHATATTNDLERERRPCYCVAAAAAVTKFCERVRLGGGSDAAAGGRSHVQQC